MQTAKPTPLLQQATRQADRWGVTSLQPVLETPDRVVLRGMSGKTAVALKLYRDLGRGGEGAAVPFLRGLPCGVGARVLRTSPLQRAVLFSWLAGPKLPQVATEQGRETAEGHFCTVAGAVIRHDFRRAFLFSRAAPRLARTLSRRDPASLSPAGRAALQRTIGLLERLTRTSPPEKVIHGDLGLGNIILTPDGPRLFDPKGYRADPALECAKTLDARTEGIAAPAFADNIAASAGRLSLALSLPADRIIGWGCVVWASHHFFRKQVATEPQHLLPYLDAYLDLCP